jgi:hypothetical protein
MDGSHSAGAARRVVVVVVALVVALSAVGGALTAVVARAATANRAAVVVEVDGVIHTAKVSFTGDSITGLDALRDAGFAPSVRVFGANGGAVCALRVGTQTIGCPIDGTCLTCGGSNYWSYFRAAAGATRYSYSGIGAGTTQVHDGDVEAWAWSSGTPPSPFVSFGDVWGPDPPPTTTTRPPAAPPTTARRPPPSTTPATNAPLGSGATVTAPTVPTAPSSSSPTAGSSRMTAAPSTSTVKRSGSATTGPITTSDRAGNHNGARKLATAPVVARGGGSPYGLVGFALVLALLLAAIVLARRRRSARAVLPT